MSAPGLTPEDVTLRASGIGASEIAAVAGISPYSGPLEVWLRKVGLAPPDEGSDAAEVGTFIEDGVARLHARRAGVRLSAKPGTMRHPLRDWQLATPDRFIVSGSGRGQKRERILEIKTTADMSRWGEAPEGLPLDVAAQVQWQMDVADLPAADVAVLFLSRSRELRVYHVERDAEVIGLLVAAGERFWRDHVLTKTPPPPDGSPACAEWLRSRYPRNDGQIIPAPDGAAEILRRYETAAAAEKDAARSKELAAQTLKLMIGAADGVRMPDGALATWKAAESGGTDWKGIAGRLLDPLGECEQAELLAQFARPGSRRLHISMPRLLARKGA